MARGVNEIQLISFALKNMLHRDGAGFDSDAALAFKIHGVQNLFARLPTADRVGGLQQTIRQRAFAVVNVSNDGEVADMH